MSTVLPSRGATWLAALTDHAPAQPGFAASLRVVDAPLDGDPCRWICVVPDPDNRFVRARTGEVGLVEGWSLAKAVGDAVQADRGRAPRVIVAVVDVASQAYGRREEALGIHQALAGAAGAYAQARLAGHPVVAMIVGKAMSGAYLAHGYQANRIVALDDDEVLIHAMGKAAAARVTMRSVEQLEALATRVPPMAYDVRRYATLGLLWKLLPVADADAPDAAARDQVLQVLRDAVDDIRRDPSRGLGSRLGGANRGASSDVRTRLAQQW